MGTPGISFSGTGEASGNPTETLSKQAYSAEFNPSDTAYPSHRCLHELFARQAAKTPHAVAVTFAHEQLTYQELDQRSNQLAHYLLSYGVGPEKLVGLFLPRSPELIVAVLGLLKAGGAYIPIDPELPRERLQLILRDAQIQWVLTHSSLSEALQAGSNNSHPTDHRPTLIPLDQHWSAITRRIPQAPPSLVRPENLIYVIYTSGSTGTPKGVMVEHRSVVSHSIGFAQRFALTESDRVLQFAPLSFDVSAEEIFPTLLSGGTLVLRPDDITLSLQSFHAFVRQERLTILNLPTPFWSEWMSEIERARLEIPSSLRCVIVGSETVTLEQFARWRKLAGDRVRWCNAYGTTEATITSTIFEPTSDALPQSVPIGKPIANTQVYILDDHQQLVPTGTSGELYIGGGEIARGYLNRPELTTKKFVPDPFTPGGRLNRTGDLARWLPDGNIEFLGRVDNQVKIRGFRVELAEIEGVLMRSSLVQQAIVLARPDSSGQKRLVAYFIPSAAASPGISELRQWVGRHLPSYMVPANYVPVATFPLTANGKVDRQALPNPGSKRPDLHQTFVAPTDDLEKALAGIWCDLLDLERVGLHDDFFELGGHSLLAPRLFTQIEKLTGRKWPLASLLDSPTVYHVAELIRRGDSFERDSSIIPIHAEGTKPPLFLVHGAGGGMLWGYANLARHLGPDQPVYCFNANLAPLPPSDGERAGVRGERFTSIPEMAAQYVKDLRAFQPQGPYYLAGYCFGGEVAFEMARQLLAQKQSVALLALFNAMPPNSSFEKFIVTPRVLLKFIPNAWAWWRYFLHWPARDKRSFLRRKARMLLKSFKRGRPQKPTATNLVYADNQIDLSLFSEEQQKLWNIHLQASAHYHPGLYPGHITLFRTPIYPFFCSFDPAFGWAEFARGGVTVKLIPGAHESILDEPHVQVTARKLKKLLHAVTAWFLTVTCNELPSFYLVSQPAEALF